MPPANEKKSSARTPPGLGVTISYSRNGEVLDGVFILAEGFSPVYVFLNPDSASNQFSSMRAGIKVSAPAEIKIYRDSVLAGKDTEIYAQLRAGKTVTREMMGKLEAIK